MHTKVTWVELKLHDESRASKAQHQHRMITPDVCMLLACTKFLSSCLMGLCFYAGPKAWPGGMSLISFFALNVFFQALVAEITTSI
jgi:hypothetical protein